MEFAPRAEFSEWLDKVRAELGQWLARQLCEVVAEYAENHVFEALINDYFVYCSFTPELDGNHDWEICVYATRYPGPFGISVSPHPLTLSRDRYIDNALADDIWDLFMGQGECVLEQMIAHIKKHPVERVAYVHKIRAYMRARFLHWYNARECAAGAARRLGWEPVPELRGGHKEDNDEDEGNEGDEGDERDASLLDDVEQLLMRVLEE